MLPHEVDLVFPYVCFAYGALMTLVLNVPVFVRLADENLPSRLVQQIRAHRALAMICLCVGGLWVLQNLWLVP